MKNKVESKHDSEGERITTIFISHINVEIK